MVAATHDFGALRLVASVGEPLDAEAVRWCQEVFGVPVIDTWWQTETGGILISPLPGAIGQKPGSATKPFFGVKPVIVDNDGVEQEGETEGNLCIGDSWPGQMRSVFGEPNTETSASCEPFRGRVA